MILSFQIILDRLYEQELAHGAGNRIHIKRNKYAALNYDLLGQVIVLLIHIYQINFGILLYHKDCILMPNTFAGYARDATGKWQVIVQTESLPQRVAIDLCHSPEKPCKKTH